MIKSVNFRGNGVINYSEFLAATMDLREMMSEERLQALFNFFDRDGSGYLTKDNIKEAF